MPASIRNILIILLISIGTHILAVLYLPQDFDEPIYVQVAADYAGAIRRGDFNAVFDYPEVREHPALVKLAYSLALLANHSEHNYTKAWKTSRTVSAVFGVLATILIGLVDPLAGGLMGLHALVVKYTSQAYLEAIPLAFSIAAVLTFLRTSPGSGDIWFGLSAISLGIATAGKFTYAPVTLVVLLYLAFFEKQIPFHRMAFFAVIALVAFFLFNVTLWHDPLRRVAEAISYHLDYQRGIHGADGAYPWYQPFVWLFASTPGDWHGGIFLYDIDPFIALFAFAGIKREWQARRWLVIWLVTGLIFLLSWGTKWPQYVLTIIPAVCLMAAASMKQYYQWFIHLSYYKSVE